MCDKITVGLSKVNIQDENEKTEEQQTVLKEEDKTVNGADSKGSRKQQRVREGHDEEAVVLERGVKGHVKWYNVWQHYGFIGRDDDPSADVFVHQSGIAKSRTYNPHYRTLGMDEKVVFDVVAGKGGGMKKAVNVTGPDGEKVRGCYFFEQYLRNYVYQERRRNYRRNDARYGYKKGRKYTDRDERNKRRNNEKGLVENDEDKTDKNNRSASSDAKEKKNTDRRRNVPPAREVKTVKGTVKEQEAVEDRDNLQSNTNDVAVEASA